MLKKSNSIFLIITLTLLLCSCSTSENKDITPANTIAGTTAPTIKPNLPKEKELIQCYTTELRKLTNSSIVSTSYENYNKSDDIIDIDIITVMNDGKTLNISASYIINEWSIITIINKDNKHYYYVPDDFKLETEMYDYDSDKQISKNTFFNSYSIKKMNYKFSSDWEQTKSSKKQHIFQEKNSKNENVISVFVLEAPNVSKEEIWSLISSKYENYTLKDETTLKIGGKKATQWDYSFDNKLSSSDATATMIKKGKYVYFVIWASKVGLGMTGMNDIPAYKTLIESITWKK